MVWSTRYRCHYVKFRYREREGMYPIKTNCDSLSVLSRVGITAEYIKCSMKHADMTSYISSLWSTSSFSPTKVHVYGHRDDCNMTLTVIESLNFQMDDLAKLITRNQMISNKTKLSPTTFGIGSISCNGKLVVSKIRASLYKIILQQKNITYLSIKHHISYDSLENGTA